jgi:hypothetical protein
MEIPIWVVICVGIAALVSLSFAAFALLLPKPKTGGVTPQVTMFEIIPLVKERLIVLSNAGALSTDPDAPEITLENMSQNPIIATILDMVVLSLWEKINTVDCGEKYDPAAAKPQLCAKSIRAYRMLPKCKRAETVDAVLFSTIAEMATTLRGNDNNDNTTDTTPNSSPGL